MRPVYNGLGAWLSRHALHDGIGCRRGNDACQFPARGGKQCAELFFGAFTAKMISVRWRRMPAWALPVFGGLTFTALALLFLTSSLWFWTKFSIVG